jgi:hypothetical protein
VIHLSGGAVANAERYHLVIAPEGAIEEEKIDFFETGEQGLVQIATAGNEGAGPAGGVIPQDQPDGVSGSGVWGKTGRPRGHRNSLCGNATGLPVSIPERDSSSERQLGHFDLSEGGGHAQEARVVLEDGPDGGGGVKLKLPGFPQENDA